MSVRCIDKKPRSLFLQKDLASQMFIRIRTILIYFQTGLGTLDQNLIPLIFLKGNLLAVTGTLSVLFLIEKITNHKKNVMSQIYSGNAWNSIYINQQSLKSFYQLYETRYRETVPDELYLNFMHKDMLKFALIYLKINVSDTFLSQHLTGGLNNKHTI